MAVTDASRGSPTKCSLYGEALNRGWNGRTRTFITWLTAKRGAITLRTNGPERLAVRAAGTPLNVCAHPVTVGAHKVAFQRLSKLLCVGTCVPSLRKTERLLAWFSVIEVEHEGWTSEATVNALAAMVLNQPRLCATTPVLHLFTITHSKHLSVVPERLELSMPSV